MKKTAISLLLFISAFFLISSGYAEIKAKTFSVTPFLGGYTFEGNEDLKTGPVFGLRFGYDITKRWGVEGILDYVKTESDSTSIDADVFGYRVEALYHFLPENKLVPFLAAGLGGRGLSYDKVLNNRQHALIDYGAGLEYFLSDRMAIRGDVRHLILGNDVLNNLEYTVGLTYYFGGPKSQPLMEKVAAASEKVEAVSEKIVADSDGDGVSDDLDKCPGTPAGVQVDQDGCQVEMQTKKEAAAAVVAKEMFEKGRATINIEFDFDKSVVKPKYHEEIQKFSDVMKNYPELKVVIEGHTDSIGGKAYNQKLSEKRANSVKDYMIKTFGIEESRLTAQGYGMSKPIDSNKTAKGRQKNRRVEAVVDYTIKK